MTGADATGAPLLARSLSEPSIFRVIYRTIAPLLKSSRSAEACPPEAPSLVLLAVGTERVRPVRASSHGLTGAGPGQLEHRLGLREAIPGHVPPRLRSRSLLTVIVLKEGLLRPARPSGPTDSGPAARPGARGPLRRMPYLSRALSLATATFTPAVTLATNIVVDSERSAVAVIGLSKLSLSAWASMVEEYLRYVLLVYLAALQHEPPLHLWSTRIPGPGRPGPPGSTSCYGCSRTVSARRLSIN